MNDDAYDDDDDDDADNNNDNGTQRASRAQIKRRSNTYTLNINLY